jgi:hypothetical protein
MLEKESFSSASSLAEALGVSLAAVLSRLLNPLVMKFFSSTLDPTPVDRRSAVVDGRKLLGVSSRAGGQVTNSFHHTITGKKSWSYLEY